jgi:hypothetical protein
LSILLMDMPNYSMEVTIAIDPPRRHAPCPDRYIRYNEKDTLLLLLLLRGIDPPKMLPCGFSFGCIPARFDLPRVVWISESWLDHHRPRQEGEYGWR